MARKMCTPFCDRKKDCPKHHDLLLAVIACTDMRDKRGNMQEFEDTVQSFLKKGWKRDEEIPDPVKNYRFPLLHWAGVLGKCRAMEWMIKNGFSTTVRSSDTQETALHRCILCLHYANIRRLYEKIRQMINMLKDCLSLQDKALQTPIHSAATKLITGIKSEYYEYCLEQMVAKALEIPGKTTEILNAQDQHGNTALHYLAQNELGFVALRAIVDAGGDVSIRNKKKLSPLDVAMNNGSRRIIKILSTAEKNSRHSSRYDSSVYTTDSPPESPVTEEVVESSKDEPSLIDHPYSLPKDSSSNNADTPALDCTEECSFDTNSSEELEASGVTEDESPPDTSAEVHSDIPNDAPSNDLDKGHSSAVDDSSSGAPNYPPTDVIDDTLWYNAPSGVTDNAPSGVTDNAPSSATDDAPCDTENASCDVRDDSSSDATDNTPSGVTDNTHSATTNDAPSGSSNSDTTEVENTAPAPAACDELVCEETDSGDEMPSDNEDEVVPAACGCNAKGVQTPMIDPYSCIVNIKQEIISSCEKCRQESMGSEITSSSELFQNVPNNDLASSVINLLKGAGLLGNITEIAEKKRCEDEHLLTDKLEMVKETNNELESSEKDIEEKKNKIEKMLTEVEELRKQVKRKTEEREQLFCKRKRLNEECNTLQKKLHCCDSLLKVVPKVDGDPSNS
ncbi:hypothetical protein ACROYT_G011952 [Oculina patagonica]